MYRREFLTTAAIGSALAASDRIRTGIIGAGGRGRYLIEQFKEMGAEVAAVCDVYRPNLAAGLKLASSGSKEYRDYRKLLDDKSIDAVIVATPDHWHAKMTIDAVEAGKDVYVEKPMAHTIDEGFDVINAVRRTKRIVQCGMQRRSAELYLESKKLLDSNPLGKIHLVTSWWLNGHTKLRESRLAPGDLDWNQWLGSAPRRSEDAKRFFNWYWYWDYSGGLLIGQAAHVLDAVQWLMNSRHPLAVTCTGISPELPGVDVPLTANICVEYPENYLATFTLGYSAMQYNTTNDQLKQFHGDKARFDLGRESYALYPESNAIDMKPSIEKKQPRSFGLAAPAHIRNFLECIKSRREPNAPVEDGQNTNIVLCMAMESLRKGRRLQWNAQTRKVVG